MCLFWICRLPILKRKNIFQSQRWVKYVIYTPGKNRIAKNVLVYCLVVLGAYNRNTHSFVYKKYFSDVLLSTKSSLSNKNSRLEDSRKGPTPCSVCLLGIAVSSWTICVSSKLRHKDDWNHPSSLRLPLPHCCSTI